MDEGQDFSLCGKAVVTEANLRDDLYWKLVADFIGAQSGEGLEVEQAACKNRLMIQVGLLREDNNFPWIVVVEWLKKIFPAHQSADFRRLIERGIATTLSLGSDARLTFLDSEVNFDFVGPICDSIGVERQHLLELKDFSAQAQLIEVTNALILELSDFVNREKISPIVIVHWLRNFNSEFCKNGDSQKAYKVLKPRIKKIKQYCRNSETRSHRRNTAMEHLLQSPFELVHKRKEKVLVKKRTRREVACSYERVRVKEEDDGWEISHSERSETSGALERNPEGDGRDAEPDASGGRDERSAAKGESLTLLDIAMLSVQKLSSVYGGKTAECKQVSLDLLRNHYALTCKEHPAMMEFEGKLADVQEDVSLVSPVVFLNYNANFLVDLHDAVEQQIIGFEKEIVLSTGEKLGRDRLPEFQSFANMRESATSRYIHMACDMLSPRTSGRQNYRKHWVAFCEEKGNPSRLAVNESNRFNNYFEAAAGLVHHHKEIALFVSDLLSMSNDRCPDVVLQSLDADANDSVIQSFVCVLAVVYCKILGPYWQLLKSGGEYSLYSQYLLCLYQRFLDWSKDPSTLLEPEDDTNVFQQFPLQERTFYGVFQYCGHWHTNRDLIRVCLKRTVKVIAAVTEEHLKDFLPGGVFSQIPSTEVNLQLVSCTFSILMAEYPFGHSYPYNKNRPDKRSRRSDGNSASDSSQEEDGPLGLSGECSDEFPNRPRKGSTHQKEGQGFHGEKGCRRRPQERIAEVMDRDYIVAAVTKNGGPCKSQQDLDKMLLRFEGKSRAERREVIRCEILYQKMILNNPDPHLDEALLTNTAMLLKLKLALPRVKPGYSLVLAPRKTKPKPAMPVAPAAAGSGSGCSSSSALEAGDAGATTPGSHNDVPTSGLLV